MADTTNLTNFLRDIADAIRTKKETTEQIPAENFDQEILSIETGPQINNQDKEITENGTYTADEGYTGLGTVTVNVPQEDLQEQLNAQDLIIQQLQEELAGKSSGEVKPNIFMQEDEPTTKDGIWLKGSYQVDNIVADENVFASEEWNTVKMSNLKAIPYQFYSGSAVAIGTDVYLLGGSGNAAIAYKYDTLTDTYTRLTNIPYQFYSGSAVAIGTNVYLFGSEFTSYYKKAYKYDTLTNTYTQLTDIPYSFYRGSAVSVGTNVYLFGGEEDKTRAYKYDTLTDTYTQLTNIPYNFYSGSAISIGTNVYLLGGSGGSIQFYKYDTLTDTYTKLTDIPYGFSYGSAISIGINVYLLGSTGTTTTYKYDTLTDTYTKLTNIPYSFYQGSAVFNGTDVYLFGGNPNPTKVQIMTMIPNDYGNNSIVISQGGFTKKTNIANYGIQNAKFYYDRVYYQNENGELLNTIPTYNGNGTEWVKISGGEE